LVQLNREEAVRTPRREAHEAELAIYCLQRDRDLVDGGPPMVEGAEPVVRDQVIEDRHPRATETAGLDELLIGVGAIRHSDGQEVHQLGNQRRWLLLARRPRSRRRWSAPSWS